MRLADHVTLNFNNNMSTAAVKGKVITAQAMETLRVARS
jgi:hypothetical protein